MKEDDKKKALEDLDHCIQIECMNCSETELSHEIKEKAFRNFLSNDWMYHTYLGWLCGSCKNEKSL